MAEQNQSAGITQVTKQTVTLSLEKILSAESTDKLIRDALQANKGKFVANVIELVKNDSNLNKCNPGDVVRECLKAVSLDMPLSKALGFAYLIPYGNKPQFQLGYKGWVQLVKRSGTIIKMHTSVIWQGQKVIINQVTGDTSVTGNPDDTQTPIGYLAYFRENNGFEKTEYMTIEEVCRHAVNYSKTVKMSAAELKKLAVSQAKNGAVSGQVGWTGNFEAMAKKTVLKRLLDHWATINPYTTEASNAEYVESRDEIVSSAQSNKVAIDDADVTEAEIIEDKSSTEQTEYKPSF